MTSVKKKLAAARKSADKLSSELNVLAKYYAAIATAFSKTSDKVKQHPYAVAGITWLGSKVTGIKAPHLTNTPAPVGDILRGESVDVVVDKLLRESVDATLRGLERKAHASGDLRDYAEWRAAGLARGIDPLKPLIDLIGRNRNRLFQGLFGKNKSYRIPKDLDLEKKVDGYTFIIKPSTGSRGAGGRVKMLCPMCGNVVAAAISAFVNGHLKRNDHKA